MGHLADCFYFMTLEWHSVCLNSFVENFKRSLCEFTKGRYNMIYTGKREKINLHLHYVICIQLADIDGVEEVALELFL